MNVKFTPRLQMQAAAAAVLLASGLALGHVAAQTPESQAAAQPVAPAQTALVAGEARDISKGALYFHANWARPNSFFRSRTKVARLDDHDFYR
jgi:spore germination cell wall hydrolase CwlJ-like protein